ncbi:glycosyltransferase family 2 protein [Bacteroides sp. OttesenSCG-928-F21]|nr:glycosyltransferase family 2 protein [Bacteroides sp. OttesenSCG-928-F21]
MERPTVSFISVNYNGYDDTCQLIESILENIRSVSYEIIVVDNASKADESELLKEKFPQVISLRSPQNLGFSGGNNLGIQYSKGDYLFFINNDTFVEDDHLDALVTFLRENETAGGVSPKIKFAFPPRNIQFAGYTPLSSVTLRNSSIGFNEPDKGQYDQIQRTSYLHGAAMMIRREVIEKIGPMPEIFFLYYEELDWCTQMSKAGYNLWYVPKWTVYHKESQSTGQESPLQVFYLTRNRLLYAWRNLTRTNKWLSIVYLATVPPIKNSVKYMFKRRFDLIKATFKGVYAFIVLNKRNK